MTYCKLLNDDETECGRPARFRGNDIPAIAMLRGRPPVDLDIPMCAEHYDQLSAMMARISPPEVER